jgi:glycosyltransferase involved in cell wall biosynthesis
MTASYTPRHIFLTIPLMDESAYLPALIACLSKQTYPHFTAIFCVNQPDQWWNQPDKLAICYSNLNSLNLLKSDLGFTSIIIDKSSPGKGWKGKNYGVGMARKTAMDKAASLAGENDLIVMMDGDTYYPANYLSGLCKTFDTHPHIKALSVPYYHQLTGQSSADLAVLRYEIYMRYYALNMMRINNPYAFTAVGSAIACTGVAYKTVNGITPHKSGEDFYFFQKMRKFGSAMIWLDATVYPAARFSDRVFFGTGPAMIRGNTGDWSGYPIFPYHFFDEVADTFQKFNILFSLNAETPMSKFLEEKFGQNFLESLRQNVKGEEKFAKACIQKVDGLRILQYLKWRNQNERSPDEKNLCTFLQKFYPQAPILAFLKQKDFSFVKATIEQLDEIRNYLHKIENTCQKKIQILR